MPFATVTENGIGAEPSKGPVPVWVFVIDRAGSATVAVAVVGPTELAAPQVSLAEFTRWVGLGVAELPATLATCAE